MNEQQFLFEYAATCYTGATIRAVVDGFLEARARNCLLKHEAGEFMQAIAERTPPLIRERLLEAIRATLGD